MPKFVWDWIEPFTSGGQSLEEWIQRHAIFSSENVEQEVWRTFLERVREVEVVRQVDGEIPPQAWDLVSLRTKASLVEGKDPVDAKCEVLHVNVDVPWNEIVDDRVVNHENIVGNDSEAGKSSKSRESINPDHWSGR